MQAEVGRDRRARRCSIAIQDKRQNGRTARPAVTPYPGKSNNIQIGRAHTGTPKTAHGLRAEPSIECIQLAHHQLFREFGAHPLPALRPQLGGPVRILRQPDHRGRHASVIFGAN